MNNDFFKPLSIEYDILEPYDFQVIDKKFHLSGDFIKQNSELIRKEDFAKKIEELGGVCRGFGESKNLTKTTDYFVIGKKEYSTSPDAKLRNYSQVRKWNNQGKKFIPVIAQQYCEELLDGYQKRNIPQ